MNFPSHTLKPKPDWQAERAKILERACLSIKAAIQRGEPIGRALRRMARRNNGRPFKADPSRRLRLSEVTMRRAWDEWKRSGESPSAFALRFSSRPSITAAVVVSFAKFCASGPRKSLATAWREFSARPGAFGHGRKKTASYDLLRCYFQASDFYLFQHYLKTIQTAQTSVAELLAVVIERSRRRLPARQPHRRAKRKNAF